MQPLKHRQHERSLLLVWFVPHAVVVHNVVQQRVQLGFASGGACSVAHMRDLGASHALWPGEGGSEVSGGSRRAGFLGSSTAKSTSNGRDEVAQQGKGH